MIAPYVFRRELPAEFADDIRANKRKIEKKAESTGQAATNVKIGVGGLRDIEFTVQLLQLRHGGRDRLLRTGNTLSALSRLRQAGWLSEAQMRELSEDYIFLRNVEHRLQIIYGLTNSEGPGPTCNRRGRPEDLISGASADGTGWQHELEAEAGRDGQRHGGQPSALKAMSPVRLCGDQARSPSGALACRHGLGLRQVNPAEQPRQRVSCIEVEFVCWKSVCKQVHHMLQILLAFGYVVFFVGVHRLAPDLLLKGDDLGWEAVPVRPG